MSARRSARPAPGWSAPRDDWGPDVLGEGFEARTLVLDGIDPDTGRPLEATLVRHRPAGDWAGQEVPRAAVLHLHGWNDYAFHWETAERLATRGVAWYGLDLRAAGRSLRPGQRHNFVEDLQHYDAELDAAREVVREDTGDVPFLLSGHSTGGLTATLWVHRHPGEVAGLVLSSPWLESLPLRGLTRLTGAALEAVARRRPDARLPTMDDGTYARVLAGEVPGTGAGAAEGARPKGGGSAATESRDPADPFTHGWDLEPAWRLSPAPVWAGWVAAALRAQRTVAVGLDLDCPVLVLTASRSDRGLGGSLTGFLGETLHADRRPAPDAADLVLDVPTMRRRAAGLGAHVTLVAVEDAIHDVFASRRSARDAAADQLERWARAYLDL